jgi:DNA replication and repair protein RecF
MNAVRVLPCRELRLRQFRNFAELDLSFPAAGVALIGDNGAGKTNLLEAIYYLEIFRSFRNSPDVQLVRFGGDAFYVRGRFGGDEVEREVEAAYEPKSQRKRVTVDGGEPARIGDAIGNVGAVVFSPSDVELVAGAPGERRRFLDIVLSLTVPGYLLALQRYRAALRQRNALLKRGAGPDLLAAWESGLIGPGAQVTSARMAWVATYAGDFAERYAAIAGGSRGVMQFRPSVPVGEAEPEAGLAAIEAAYTLELRRVENRERERGMTLVGPHRDDLGLGMGADGGGTIDLREFGSGGQRRTAAIALRMVEAVTLRRARGTEPLILLDDVFAELDSARSLRILEWIDREAKGQVILTAPKESDVQVRDGALVRWRIAAGEVHT